jgi:hypothetical protein
VALVKKVKESNLDVGRGAERTRVRHEDTTLLTRKYNSMVLGGKVRAAIQMVTNKKACGAYRPHDLDSKSGCPIIDVLCDKHLASQLPSDDDFNVYPDVPGCLDTIPVYCYKKCVPKAAAHLSGSVGLCRVESKMLKHWLLHHKTQSECLRKAMMTWVDWLSHGLPPYAMYCAVNMVHTVALNKTPSVRLLGVGEVWMHLWFNCSHAKTKVEAASTCKNLQLCVGLCSGIEANFHAIRAIWPQSTRWTEDGDSTEGQDGDPQDTATMRGIH